MEILKKLPKKEELLKKSRSVDNILKVNGHIHTPYSFSSFSSLKQAVDLAKDEDIKVLGINDFFVFDGYEDFIHETLEKKIFPLLNIEFIGLLKEEQKEGIRINDPNNPGRIYFSGKGLDFPVDLPLNKQEKLQSVKDETQKQVKEMVMKASDFLQRIHKDLKLSYQEMKRKYAHDLVRERHVARAIRVLIFEVFNTRDERLKMLQTIFSGKEVQSDLNNEAALENEIRSNLLKKGGKAFVEENQQAFLALDEIIDIIRNAGGIPCYPVLLDDKNGNITEYEEDFDKLYQELSGRNICCLELIPGRNSIKELERFVQFFNNKGFIITFGTEHNSPGLSPLQVRARDARLSEELLKINQEGACIIAAHQYERSRGNEGYTGTDNLCKSGLKEDFIQLGHAVIREVIAP